MPDAKYPGFDNLLDYLKHLKDRATELKAKHVTVPIEALDEAIENVWMYQELNK